MLKTCPQCNQEFKTYRTAAIYCNKTCQNASQVRAKTYTCTGCGTDFQRPNHIIKREAKNRFCTSACHKDWLKRNAHRASCEVCGEEFKNPNKNVRHCSWECRNIGLRRRATVKCTQCGELYERRLSHLTSNRNFCSHRCSTDYRVGVNHHFFKQGRWLERGTRWRRIRQEIIERDGKCLWCGATSNPSGGTLHVHHIKPRREYLFVDFANDQDNLVTLCSSCHMTVEMRLHHGRIADVPKWLRPPA